MLGAPAADLGRAERIDVAFNHRRGNRYLSPLTDEWRNGDDLEQLLTLIGLDYCAELNSDDKHDADLPLFNNRSYGGTMTIWRKSLDKFVSIHPTTS